MKSTLHIRSGITDPVHSPRKKLSLPSPELREQLTLSSSFGITLAKHRLIKDNYLQSSHSLDSREPAADSIYRISCRSFADQSQRSYTSYLYSHLDMAAFIARGDNFASEYPSLHTQLLTKEHRTLVFVAIILNVGVDFKPSCCLPSLNASQNENSNETMHCDWVDSAADFESDTTAENTRGLWPTRAKESHYGNYGKLVMSIFHSSLELKFAMQWRLGVLAREERAFKSASHLRLLSALRLS